MKKRYTRKQILESLQYWRSQLKLIKESEDNFDDFDTQVQSDELDDGSYEEGQEEDNELDYSEYEAAAKRHQKKQEENLEAERKYLGLGPDEVVCLIMGSLCIYDSKTHETRSLTKEQYDKYSELSKKWHAEWEENVGKHWPKKKSKKIKESLSKGNTMNKKYTKKQITEAIAYWKKQLTKLDESSQVPRLSSYKSIYLALLAHVICSMRRTVKDANGNGDLKQALTDVFVQYSGGDQADDYTSTEISQLLAKPLKLGDMKIPLATQDIPPELQYFMPFKKRSEEEIRQLLKDAPEEVIKRHLD